MRTIRNLIGVVAALVTLAGCSNPKTIECPMCGSTAFKAGHVNTKGIRFDVYMCHNEHRTFREQ